MKMYQASRQSRRTNGAALVGSMLLFAQSGLQAASPVALATQIVDAMGHAPGVQPGYRPTHAKGIVVKGSFAASAQAATISRAAHFSGAAVPVTVRFSDGGADPMIPDTSPDAAPRGMAIRFEGARATDIVAISHNGFLVGTGEEFLALIMAQATTDPSKPHPWPIETFLGSHPNALKFVQDPKPMPVSMATEAFYSNNALRFVNKSGAKQAGRYQIVPVDGPKYLDDATGKAKGSDYLGEELRARLAQGPAKFRLLLQLANAGDRTDDGSFVWPDDRRTVELGILSLTSVVPDSAAAEKDLAFDPARVTDGIELSDDPLPTLRSIAYAISVGRRRGK
jgi:catalase